MTTASDPYPRFLPNGDTALTVEFGAAIDRAIAARVVTLSRRLAAADVDGLVETVPTFRSLIVHFDPDRVASSALEERVTALLPDLDETSAGTRLWTIPACYDAAVAPDLQDVGARTGLTGTQITECHAAETYFVYMIGFLPGYPYLGDVPEPLVLPRREDPRTRVPPGSLAIAQTMSAVYTIESPGGWHIIGRTPAPLFDAETEPPARLAPGDLVRFEPVSIEALSRLEDEVRDGRFRLSHEEVGP